MTRDDDPLLIAVGRTLKNVIAKTDARIAALEQRIASLERQLNLSQRVEALEQRAVLGEQPRRWDS